MIKPPCTFETVQMYLSPRKEERSGEHALCDGATVPDARLEAQSMSAPAKKDGRPLCGACAVRRRPR